MGEKYKRHKFTDNKELAKYMRKNMTKYEGLIWHTFLKYHPIKIVRQKMINDYIIDFYCAKAQLAIEIDGSQHYTEKGEKEDKVREMLLNSYGIEVLRIPNEMIKYNIDEAMYKINEKINERLEILGYSELKVDIMDVMKIREERWEKKRFRKRIMVIFADGENEKDVT